MNKLDILEEFVTLGVNREQAAILAEIEKELKDELKRLTKESYLLQMEDETSGLDQDDPKAIELRQDYKEWLSSALEGIDNNLLCEIEIVNGEVKSLLIYTCSNDNLTFSTVPDKIGGLRSLKNLILRGSEGRGLEFLPDSIGNLTSLVHLSLVGNSIINFPASIGNLTNLSTLYISSHNVHFPNSIKEIPSLTIINESDKKIDEMEYSIIQRLIK